MKMCNEMRTHFTVEGYFFSEKQSKKRLELQYLRYATRANRKMSIRIRRGLSIQMAI